MSRFPRRVGIVGFAFCVPCTAVSATFFEGPEGRGGLFLPRRNGIPSTLSDVALSMLSSRKVFDVLEEKGVSGLATSIMGESAEVPSRKLAKRVEDTLTAFGFVLRFGDAIRGGELGGEYMSVVTAASGNSVVPTFLFFARGIDSSSRVVFPILCRGAVRRCRVDPETA